MYLISLHHHQFNSNHFIPTWTVQKQTQPKTLNQAQKKWGKLPPVWHVVLTFSRVVFYELPIGGTVISLTESCFGGVKEWWSPSFHFLSVLLLLDVFSGVDLHGFLLLSCIVSLSFALTVRVSLCPFCVCTSVCLYIFFHVSLLISLPWACSSFLFFPLSFSSLPPYALSLFNGSRT